MHFFALLCTSLHFFALPNGSASLKCTSNQKCKTKMHFLPPFLEVHTFPHFYALPVVLEVHRIALIYALPDFKNFKYQ